MDLRQFGRKIRVTGNVVEENGGKLLRSVALAVDAAVVLATPVDTGRARSNWQVEIGAAAQIQLIEPLEAAQRAVSMAVFWLQDQQGLNEKGRLAREWVAQHTGATTRIMQQITELEAARAQTLPLQR